jgi:hypothetical protein
MIAVAALLVSKRNHGTRPFGKQQVNQHVISSQACSAKIRESMKNLLSRDG